MILFFSTIRIASAQLPDGSIAPDFDATDVYGNTYNLYDLLAQGKSVVIEFFVAWDATDCWTFHQTHTLNDLWSTYGPEGTDELYLFMIEVDGSTGVNCLFGQDDCETPNWMEGTDYPVINSANIGYQYEVSYWPTIYYVCPSKQVFQTGAVGAESIYSFVGECPTPSEENLGELIQYNGDIQDFCDELTFTPSATFQNFGTNEINSASFALYQNDEFIDSLVWTGNLETYATTTVEFPERTIYESSSLAITVLDVNDMPNAPNQYDSLSVIYHSPRTQEENIVVNLRTDSFGNETYWEIRDEWGNVITSGGNELVGADGGGFPISDIGINAYSNNTDYSIPVNVPPYECLEFLIVDDYGDGMCCTWGDGYYEILDEDGVVLLDGGHFQISETRNFTVGALTTLDEPVQESPFSIFPNPADNQVIITLQSASTDWDLRIYDQLGREIEKFSKCLSPGYSTFEIDCSDYNCGIYFLTFSDGNTLFQEKVIISR